MSRLMQKIKNQARRKNRVRSTVVGTTERPRLTVFVSNIHVTAQIIDDSKQHTLAYVTTVGQKIVSGTKTERAKWVGDEIAKKAKTVKVKKVVFDRNGKLYHGRIKALAEAARSAGLDF